VSVTAKPGGRSGLYGPCDLQRLDSTFVQLHWKKLFARYPRCLKYEEPFSQALRGLAQCLGIDCARHLETFCRGSEEGRKKYCEWSRSEFAGSQQFGSDVRSFREALGEADFLLVGYEGCGVKPWKFSKHRYAWPGPEKVEFTTLASFDSSAGDLVKDVGKMESLKGAPVICVFGGRWIGLAEERLAEAVVRKHFRAELRDRIGNLPGLGGEPGLLRARGSAPHPGGSEKIFSKGPLGKRERRIDGIEKNAAATCAAPRTTTTTCPRLDPKN